MKSKLVVLALALGCLCGRAKADIVVDISAACAPTPNPEACPVGTVVDLEAQITVAPVLATYYSLDVNGFFTGVEDQVMSLTGTLNGVPVILNTLMTGAPLSPPGIISSWVDPDHFLLGNIYFTVGGQNGYLALDQFGPSLNSPTIFSDVVTVDYQATAVNTPEPSTLTLLGAALVLGLYKGARRRRANL